MADYIYRCVAGPANIGVKTEKERAEAVKEFERIINEQASAGWEYVGMDEYHTTIPKGCLGTGDPKISTLKLLVFRQPKIRR